jgi:hypothetical protein
LGTSSKTFTTNAVVLSKLYIDNTGTLTIGTNGEIEIL